jgi:hypothetical protein
MMVAALANGESLFGVLGTAARRRTVPGLAIQLLVCGAIGALILAVAPAWWPVASLLGAPTGYAAWGLLARRLDRSPPDSLALHEASFAVAVTGTVCALAGILGLALALYTGEGRSPYNACGTDATHPRCRAWADPPSGRLPIP